MLVAQALAEYGAMAALVDAFSSLYYVVRDALGEWGTTGLGVAVVALVLWSMITRVRR